MEDNRIILEHNLLEDDDAMTNQKLEVLDILKEAPTIVCKNFNFIFLLFTSHPLFFFMVYYEIFLQRTLLEIPYNLEQTADHVPMWPIPDFITERMNKEFVLQLVQLCFLYLVPLHLLKLCTMIVTVDLACKIYAEERPMTLKEMIKNPIHGARMRGTFITYFYVLLLSTCALLGLTWLVTNYYVTWRNTFFYMFFVVFYGAAFAALLTKFLEWSAVWNMSIIISVLEGTYGAEALALSAYFSKDFERRGMFLMLVFFVWEQGLRLPCLYFGCYEGGIEILVQVSLFCLGNMLKWVVCVIYFYDCKKRTLEKKFDEEVGREIKAVDASLSWEEKKYRESVPNSVYLLLATFYIDLFSRNRDKPWIFAVLYPEFVAIRCL
ncbi:hypothetical protein I3843_05G135400 [Carya illinoinensis]|nr:hypothetical protein I3843_05G135400 [Carya illinoinensis]